MIFWIVAFLTIAGVAAIILTALLQGQGGGVSGAASDISVYRDQLDEVDRDRARGVLTEAEAEAVRIEVSRRLLEADRRDRAATTRVRGGQRVAAVLVPAVLLLGGGGLYFVLGSPGARDMPMAARLAVLNEAAQTRPSQDDAEALAAGSLPRAPEPEASFLDLMERLRAALEERPDDVPGLMLLARNEARLGNFAAARAAQEHLVRVKGDEATADDLAVTVEMMVFSTGGYVSPEAEGYLRRLLQGAPNHGAGRYFLGLLHAQNGRPDQAFPVWRRLLEQSPPDAPWNPVIRAEIGAMAAAAGVDYDPPELRGPSSEDVAAASDMSAEDRAEMIRGMVEGLSARLADEGGPPEEWARLLRALMVLGEDERAQAIYAEAKATFGHDEAAMAVIFRAGIDAGLE